MDVLIHMLKIDEANIDDGSCSGYNENGEYSLV